MGSGEPDELVAALRAAGTSAGLDAVGVASADPFDDVREVLEQRAALGLAGGMQFTYRNPARSTDPGRALPGARSLVVGALGYEREEPDQHPEHYGPEHHGPERHRSEHHSPEDDRSEDHSPGDHSPGDHSPGDHSPEGRHASSPRDQPYVVPARVARSARSDHYARLRAGLTAISDELRRRGWRTLVLADDNALVDRAAAQRAGIGWYGKNTNILLPGTGSWFVLGSVVTDAELPADRPVVEGCGTCRRCLPACPTGALVAPGVLDARRCLSWLAQAPGVFPREYRVALGDRLYGCDDCQEVCPVNRLHSRRETAPPPEADAVSRVDALDLLRSDDATLLARHGRWYLAARQVRWLRRNALLVLGNTADPAEPAVVAAIQAALADPDPALRGPAVWAAARLGLGHLLPDGDPDSDVAAELAAVATVASRRVGSETGRGIDNQTGRGVDNQTGRGAESGTGRATGPEP